jgi:hypothetical protein
VRDQLKESQVCGPQLGCPPSLSVSERLAVLICVFVPFPCWLLPPFMHDALA